MILMGIDKSTPPDQTYGDILVIRAADKESGGSDEILLLIIHQRCGHMPFPLLQDMTRTGVIPRTIMGTARPSDYFQSLCPVML